MAFADVEEDVISFISQIHVHLIKTVGKTNAVIKDILTDVTTLRDSKDVNLEPIVNIFIKKIKKQSFKKKYINLKLKYYILKLKIQNFKRKFIMYPKFKFPQMLKQMKKIKLLKIF